MNDTNRPARRRRLLAWAQRLGLLSLAVLLSACAAGVGAPEPASFAEVSAATQTAAAAAGAGQPQPAGGQVINASFTTDDGLTLSGRLYGSGDTVALLAHMRPSDQQSWQPFAQKVAAAGYAAFTFDFRGYGASGGQRAYNLIDRDVRAAIAFLRGRGFSNIVLIGASMGAVACAKNTHEANVAGLALISSPRSFETIEVAGADLTEVDYSKLFVASEDDEPYVTDVRTLHSWASAPKEIKLFSGRAHGTDLLASPHQAELESDLLDLIRAAAGHG